MEFNQLSNLLLHLPLSTQAGSRNYKLWSVFVHISNSTHYHYLWIRPQPQILHIYLYVTYRYTQKALYSICILIQLPPYIISVLWVQRRAWQMKSMYFKADYLQCRFRNVFLYVSLFGMIITSSGTLHQ